MCENEERRRKFTKTDIVCVFKIRVKYVFSPSSEIWN